MKILFVCTGNTCRSPMAAALLNHWASCRSLPLEADSAGLFAHAGQPLSPYAGEVLAEKGIFPEAKGAKPMTRALADEADRIVAMTEDHARYLRQTVPTETPVTTLPADIPDPFGGTVAQYRACLDAIETALHEWLEGEGLI